MEEELLEFYNWLFLLVKEGWIMRFEFWFLEYKEFKKNRKNKN